MRITGYNTSLGLVCRATPRSSQAKKQVEKMFTKTLHCYTKIVKLYPPLVALTQN